MKSLIYKFAFLISIIAFVSGLLNGISLFTSLFRSVLVFMATIFVVIISLNMLRWSLLSANQPPQAQTTPGKSETGQTNAMNE